MGFFHIKRSIDLRVKIQNLIYVCSLSNICVKTIKMDRYDFTFIKNSEGLREVNDYNEIAKNGF